MFKKTNEDRKKKKIVIDENQVFSLAGLAAGGCAGMVVKAGIDMITPPALKPVEEIGFKVGKWIIAGIATAAIENHVARDLKENYEAIRCTIAMCKVAKSEFEKEIEDYNQTQMEAATS